MSVVILKANDIPEFLGIVAKFTDLPLYLRNLTEHILGHSLPVTLLPA